MAGNLPTGMLTSPGNAPMLPKLPLTPGAPPSMPPGMGPPDMSGMAPPPMDMTSGGPPAAAGDPMSQVMQHVDDMMAQLAQLKSMLETLLGGAGGPPPGP